MPTPFIPSAEQSAIYSLLSNPVGGNIMVGACPGSGKTTTIINGFQHAQRAPGALCLPSICYLVFNKRNADEAKAKCPSGVSVSTFHSLGLRALKDSGRCDPAAMRSRDFVNASKCRRLVYNAAGRDNPDAQLIIRLVGLLKTLATAEPGRDGALALVTAHNLDFADRDKALRIALAVLEKSNADLSCIDFDDMLYLPVILGCAFDRFDYVFTDECQDTNEVQMAILERLAKPTKTTRFVFVGDPHQGIYGFRGSDATAIDKLTTRFSCTVLPLSVSYRCPQAVVLEAQRVLGGNTRSIQPHPSAPVGEVATLVDYVPERFTSESVILCRNTAPLVGFAYSLLQRDIPCVILGKDIATQLVGIVKKMRATSLADFCDKLLVWRDREAGALIVADRSPERIDDQYECLRFFVHGLDETSRTVESLIARIDLMFSDTATTGRVILSTIHKAKGTEFATVFILDRLSTLPSRFAKQPWQQTQEKNLWFVAVTRAQERLYYINSDCWKQENE